MEKGYSMENVSLGIISGELSYFSRMTEILSILLDKTKKNE